ncbi:MAG: efflux RND transporter periplasmic adaptor subunit [Propionivibrio sp.]|uniref:efflux RND transporter periplasmic adaptor subunit n=1 Tax=Propionivibrio sp. TaxID=2212460 RepID=UPI0025F3ACD9|nr:efflux RND transporter periplasmic adaptor subunit [Propionivibrio sp.]MBK8893818.1 efflux RND transporter periplasmic adaptor subunit [Propionivibrio sp.]
MTKTEGRAAALVGILTVALLAAAGGYRLGARSLASAPDDMRPAASTPGEVDKKVRKLLYYRNPMGLPDTSPAPKKDPMGMEYIAVYEGEEDDANTAGDEPASTRQIKISTDKIQKLGVRTEAAQLRELGRVVRASGRIEPDERRVFAITPKFEGYVERLYVNVTGQPVGKGQPLFEAYSPELVSAQREYAIAAQGVEALKNGDNTAQSGMKELAESSLLRLKNWDISEEQIKTLVKSGESKRTLVFRSPVNGIITEKKALQGMRFMPGEMLYQVADLSSVWVIADVFEQDIGLVKTGAKAKVTISAYPDKTFDGTITYVYPTLNAQTRTVPVRVELANPGLRLKPSMFAQVELPISARAAVITVPVTAVIDSGTRQIVLVQAREGRYEPREVKLGARSDHYVEVIEGVKNEELVVVAANFLIDAESNLKAAVGGFGQAAPGDKTPPAEASAKPATTGAGHRAEGKVEEIDAKTGVVSIRHGAVDSLKWPAMTMEFKPANETLLKVLKPGATVAFEFVERAPGEWVITSVKPAANPHAGH